MFTTSLECELRLIDLARIFKYLVMRKSRSKFVIDPPKGGVNSFMASHYLESFAGLIVDDEALLNGSKGFIYLWEVLKGGTLKL